MCYNTSEVKEMPILSTRKIVKVGNSYMVSLPSGWVRWIKRHLKTDELVVEVLTNTEIIIRVPEQLLDKEVGEGESKAT